MLRQMASPRPLPGYSFPGCAIRTKRSNIQLDRVGTGSGKEEQLVDDLGEPRHFLELHLERLAVRGRERVAGEHLLGVQADERERNLQLVRGVSGEAAHLAERRLQPV